MRKNMADLKNEIKINNENNGQQCTTTTVHISKIINETTTRRKQAFGELKNVIHNQLKFENIRMVKHMPNSVIQDKAARQNGEKVTHKSNEAQAVLKYEEEIELLNYIDFERVCCARPYKGDRQIWSEANMFDDALVDKIMQSGSHDDKEEPTFTEDYGPDDSGCEDFLNLRSSMLFSDVRISDTDDLLPPPPPLPSLGDRQDFDDFYLEM